MAGAVVVSFDTSQWSRALRNLGAKGRARIARGVNRTADSAKVAQARSVATDLGVKVGVAKEAISVQKATAQRLSAHVVCRGARIPLIDLGARGPEPSRGRGRGVTVKRKRYPRAFIATMRSGHRGVFERRGTSRLPIDELRGASTAHVFAKHAPLALARFNDQLAKNVSHEIQFLLKSVKAA